LLSGLGKPRGCPAASGGPNPRPRMAELSGVSHGQEAAAACPEGKEAICREEFADAFGAVAPGMESAEACAALAGSVAPAVFHLKPSVGSWLRPLHYVPRSEARRAAVVKVPFHLKASVGSWLMLRPPRQEAAPVKDQLPLAKAVEDPWHADFEAFADSGGGASKFADLADACPTPSTGLSAFSPVSAAKLAMSAAVCESQPAEVPHDDAHAGPEFSRMRSALMPPEPGDKEKHLKMAHMRSALLPEPEVPDTTPEVQCNAGQEAESGDSIPMSRMRSALIPPAAANKVVPGEKQAIAEEAEPEEGSAVSHMRSAVAPPQAMRKIMEAEKQRIQEGDEEGEADPQSRAQDGDVAAMEEEVVAPGAGQRGVPLARAGGPPPGHAQVPAPPAVPTAPLAPAAPPPEPTSMKELDELVAHSLDHFFGDEQNWKKVGREIASSTKGPAAQRRLGAGLCRFRIQVPKPYPGVQYRRSKCLDDRYPRFAENGSMVQGRVEDNGEWLKVGEQIYLPMRVGAVRIMEALPSEDGEAPPAAAAAQSPTAGFWNWLACCSGERPPASGDSEVLVGNDEGTSQRSPQLRGGGPRPPTAGAASLQQPFAGPAGAATGAVRSNGPSQASGGNARPAQIASEEDADFQGPRRLPEDVSRNPLSNLDAANRHFSSPINPFSDVASAGSASPSKRRTESRVQNDSVQSTLPDAVKDVFQA